MNASSRRVRFLPWMIVLVTAFSNVTGCSSADRATHANTRFIARAESICAQTKAKLDALPEFPFKGFDALHPDPRLLSKIGRFFVTRDNELPILRIVETSLRALGNPRADGQSWRDVLTTFHDFVLVIQREQTAALSANVDAWLAAVRENRRLPDRLTAATKAFGAERCAILR